jgi:serine/threonine-protein kinase
MTAQGDETRFDDHGTPPDGLAPGAMLGSYKIVRKIGKGGMGEVFLVQHTVLNQKRALKVILEKRSNDPCIVQRFINEVMVHAKLEHDNIVRVYDAGNVSGLRYLVMKYVDGSTLAEFIGKGQGMRLPAARRCLEEILTGLAYAHGKSVIHRDIKPSNIFVTEAGKCKIGDFGGAFEQESSGSGYTCIGTP